MHQLRTLGGVDLRDAEGREVQALLAQPKRLALLVYLALAPVSARYRRRDSVLALFWPESDTERARASLRQALRYLRRALGDGVVSVRGEEELGIGAGTLQCDAAMLVEACRGRDWLRAMEHYAGDFLDGFHVTGAAAELDQWIDGERSRLRELACEAAWALADEALAAHDGAGALRWGREGRRLAGDEKIAAERLRRVTAQAHALVALPAVAQAEDRAAPSELAAPRQVGPAGVPGRARSWRSPAVVSVFAATAAIAAVLALRPSASTALPTREQVTYSGNANSPALAPDGRTIAYVEASCPAGADTCTHELVARDLAGGPTVSLARGTSIYVNSNPKWNPDGGSVLFQTTSVVNAGDTTPGGTYLVQRFGGRPQRIGPGGGAAFSANGEAVVLGEFVSDGTIWLRFLRIADREVFDSTAVPLARPPVAGVNRGLYDLDWSPDGKWLALLVYRGQGDRLVVLVSRHRGVVTDSMRVPGRRVVRWVPKGDAVLLLLQGGSSDDKVLRRGVDPRTGRFTGDTATKAVIPAGGGTFAVSRDGATLAFVDQASTTTELIAMERDGERVTARPVQAFTGWSSEAVLSPDGHTIALSRGDPRGTSLYLIPFEGGDARPIASVQDLLSSPRWLRDRRLVFKRGLPGTRLFVVNLNGSHPRPFGPAEYTTGNAYFLQWLDDSLYVLDQRNRGRLLIVDASGSIRDSVTVPDTLNNLLTVTPDARRFWFFYRNYADGRILSMDRATGTVTFAFDLPRPNSGVVGWADGAYVVATWPRRTASAPTVWRVNPSGTFTRLAVLPRDCDFQGLTMSRDARRFVCKRTDTKTDIWLLHGLDLNR